MFRVTHRGGRGPRSATHRRRGATLVLVAVLMVVLFAFTAFAIDLGQAYLYRAQLQTTADAAALAAVVEIRERTPELAPVRALENVAYNPVRKMTADVELTDIVPGQWDDAANPKFTPKANWTDQNVNAALVTARHTMPYSFARVLGFDNLTITTQAIAAVGYVQGVDCVKPWAVSYEAMLSTLYDSIYKLPRPPLTYDLTPADIFALSSGDPEPPTIWLLFGNQSQVTPGNIGKVNTWNYDPNANDTPSYVAAIQGCPGTRTLFPGEWLYGSAGAGSGQSTGAVQNLCGVSGNPHEFSCDQTVKVVIYDIHNELPGNNIEYRVKYIGVFKIVSYCKGTGNSWCKDEGGEQIGGKFIALEEPGGNFSMKPSPIFGPIALVR